MQTIEHPAEHLPVDSGAGPDSAALARASATTSAPSLAFAASNVARVNLLDYDRQGLRDLFAQFGEKPYRAEQVMKWIYHRHVTDFAAMTDVGKALRDKLEATAEIVPPKILFEKRPPTPRTSGCSGWTAATRSKQYSFRSPHAARCAYPRRLAAD